jgi:hypothetical protein
VLDVARKYIGDRFDAAMGMPGKASQVVLGYVIPKIVQQ